MIIYLDDIRIPTMSHSLNKGLGLEYSEWIIIRNYFDFIKIIDDNFDKIELISFDHDLACYKSAKEYTGKDAVDYLINYCIDNNKSLPDWYLHTDNTCGRENMTSIILNYLKVIEGLDVSSFKYYHKGMIKRLPI